MKESATPTPEQRAQIADALYRFCAGQDLRDRPLFETSFAADATLDFRQPAERLGAKVSVFEGLLAISEAVFAAIDRLNTTHTATNVRVTRFSEEHASATALVEAQHLPVGDHGRHLLLKNFYRLELSSAGDLWLIDEMKISLAWHHGDASVLFPNVRS